MSVTLDWSDESMELSTTVPAIFRDIKLVIWDLDETLWSGTLTEGGVAFSEHNELLLRRLAQHGIVSSICSNNDFEQASTVLRSRGLWEYFVFPKISWGQKSAMVSEIVEGAQLRAPQVLFIDDNARIRAEVAETTGVATSDSRVLPTIAADSLPLTDPSLKRLEQYRLLEAKYVARRSAETASDDEFLRSSEIGVAFEDAGKARDRILELIGRTNQLNFTKKRISAEELDALLGDERLKTGAVRGKDRFGDYGIVGFYAVDIESDRLLHFLFSCRVLNLGIESFVYQYLHRPRLEVVGPVTTDVLTAKAVDWISRVESGGDAVRDTPATAGSRVLVLGGCDLVSVGHYLRRARELAIDWEVFSVVDGVQQYARSGLNVLRTHLSGRHADILNRIPWVGPFATDLASWDYDVVLLSLWVDYACLNYRHRETGILIPTYRRLAVEDSDEVWKCWWGPNTTHRQWFLDSFELAPAMSPGDLADSLRWLRQTIPSSVRLAMINGPEIEKPWSYPLGEKQHFRHQAMNAALDSVKDELGIELIDLRKLATLPHHVTNMMTHFSRDVYQGIAAQFMKLETGREQALQRPSRLAERPARE